MKTETIYPTTQQAYKALNILIWYCVWNWTMKEWKYHKDSDSLLYDMRWWVRMLHSELNALKKYE